MILAFVPVRLKSSRLPNKAISDIYGVPAIERCLINALSISNVDKVILATSDTIEDDVLMKYNLGGQVEVVRGPENDVLERIMPSLDKYRPDHVLRITGDSPVVSYELSEELINFHIEKNSDATYINPNVAHGIAADIYKKEALLKLKKLQPVTSFSEYLIYYFTNNPNIFAVNEFNPPQKFIQDWRVTLDNKKDSELINLIFKHHKISNRAIQFEEILSFFNKYPNAKQINLNTEIKYRSNKEVVDSLKSNTTIKSDLK